MDQNLVPKPVHQFPPVPGGLTKTSKVPIAQRSSQEDPADYHSTMAEVFSFLETIGMVAVPSGGIRYKDDIAAGEGGVGLGKFYVLSENNSYDLPGGLPKMRTYNPENLEE